MTVQRGFVQANSNTSEGNQTFTDPNMTVAVLAAEFYISKGDVLGADEGDLNLGFGFCNSSAQWSVSSNANTGSDPTDNTRSFKTNRCIHLFASGTTTAHRIDASWVSFGVGTVTINHEVAPSDDYVFTVVMHGGSSFNSAIGTGTPNTTVGNTMTIGSLAFQPEGGIFGYTGEDPNNTTAQQNHQIGMGFMSYDGTTILQACQTQRADNGDTSGSEVRQGINKSRIAMGVNSNGSETHGLEVTSVTSNSVVITTRSAAANNDFGYFLFTMGGDNRVKVIDFDSPTSEGDDPITDVGFEVKGLYSVSTSLVTTNLDDNDEHAGSFCYGVAIEDNAAAIKQGSIRGAIEDASDPTDNEASTESALVRVTDDDSSVGVAGSLSSFDSGGITTNWSDVKGVSWAGFALVYGEPDSSVSIALDTLTLASAAQTATITPGAVSPSLNTVTIAGSSPAMSLSPGATSTLLNELALAVTTNSTAVNAGAISTPINTLTLAGSVEALTLGSAGVSVLLDALSLATSAESVTLSPGATSALLNALTLATSAEGLTVSPGQVTVNINTLTLSGSLVAVTINVVGQTAIAISPITLFGGFVTNDRTVSLDTLTLASSGESLTVSPSAISTILDTLSLASAANINSVSPGATSILLNVLSFVGSVESTALSTGATSILLDALTLATSAETTVLSAGATAIVLDALSLAVSGEALSVSSGTISTLLDTLSLAASAEGASLDAGIIAIALDTLTLAGTAESASIQAGLIVALASVLLDVSPPTMAADGGAVSALLDTLSLAGSVEGLSLDTGATAIILDALNLASMTGNVTARSGLAGAALDTLTLATSAENTTLDTGAIAILLDALSLASSPQSISAATIYAIALAFTLKQKDFDFTLKPKDLDFNLATKDLDFTVKQK